MRPSIIESSLAEPRPGWIRGFRMAEPVIISYARGLLKEFPGVPEGVVDVIPVDLVAAAIIATAAEGPQPEPKVVQVASGSRNPLRYRRLVELVHGWFSEHPLYDSAGQPIVVKKWSFPGRGRVQGQLTRAKNTLERTERILQTLPLRGKQAEWNASLEEKREEAERALAYVELYGAYAECEAIYGVDRLLELWDSLPREDQRRLLLRSRGDRLGRATSATSTCRPSSTTPECAPLQADAPARPATRGCAARCSRPSVTWRRSTSRTRSSHRTSSPRTRGWPPAGCRPTIGCASSLKTLGGSALVARARPQGSLATSCASSIVATTARPSSSSTRTRPRCSRR